MLARQETVELEEEGLNGSLPLEPVDGGDGRSCRGEDAGDKSARYFTLFSGVPSLGECAAKCGGAAPKPPSVGECPRTVEGRSFGRVSSSQIDECSGLAAGRRNPGLYWINNDSGDRQRLYAIDKYGKHRARLWVNGARARDWEDVAMGPGPAQGGSYLYVADTGDNRRGRGVVQIYRFREPEVTPGRHRNADIHVSAQRFDVRYPEGPRDCEAMFVDQGPTAERLGTLGRVYIITKGDGKSSDRRWRGGDVYWVDLPARPAALTFTHAGRLPIAYVTGADISPSGSLIVLRTYGELLMWPRPESVSVESSLAGSVCKVHRKRERQGEAVCFGADGDHYLTVSEGRHPAVWYFGLPQSYARTLESTLEALAPQASPAQCQGIDYAAKSGQCEVWHRPGGIKATVPLAGHTCLRAAGGRPPTTPAPQPKCGGTVLRDVELVCPSADGSGCKVLADRMRGKTCRDYCGRNGLACSGGWEEQDENCVPTVALGCDRTYGTTSDLICECAPQPPSTTPAPQPKCGGTPMRDVELVCPSVDGSACKVLANRMRGKTCRDYCRRNGLACAGGWEEQNENCVPTHELGCDRTYGRTSDLICECVPQ